MLWKVLIVWWYWFSYQYICIKQKIIVLYIPPYLHFEFLFPLKPPIYIYHKILIRGMTSSLPSKWHLYFKVNHFDLFFHIFLIGTIILRYVTYLIFYHYIWNTNKILPSVLIIIYILKKQYLESWVMSIKNDKINIWIYIFPPKKNNQVIKYLEHIIQAFGNDTSFGGRYDNIWNLPAMEN